MIDPEHSFLEVGHCPLGIQRKWSQDELLLAAQKSVCRNTGWPVGVVLRHPQLSPKPVKDGIRAVVRTATFADRFDFWSLDRNGCFYFLRSLEEDSVGPAGPGTHLYFDTRIWRIAESLLHCANLYRELEVPNETEIRVAITHSGLRGRKLSASDPMRAATMFDRVSHENESKWEKTVPIGTIEPNLEPLVGEVCEELFMLFDYWKPQPEVWKGILQAFIGSKV
jgi:hypothetical protein